MAVSVTDFVSEKYRTNEHARVDREIDDALSAGWGPDDWNDPIQNYSEFLYAEVSVAFLDERVKAIRRRNQQILKRISGNRDYLANSQAEKKR